MRKLILVALGGFAWRWVQRRFFGAPRVRPRRF